ncbi:hypothetical protein AB0F16_01420 [Streptomyces tanashiensis]|uniref:hypothetical protein n=1 Tax=Streptomyces tanashiensis TaxID=67367 RepID=UPI0033C8309B
MRDVPEDRGKPLAGADQCEGHGKRADDRPAEYCVRDDSLRALGAVGAYDASVVTKDDAGKVHVNKDESAGCSPSSSTGSPAPTPPP